MSVVLAFFHNKIFLEGGFTLDAVDWACKKTASWSLIPGSGLQCSISEGRFVMKRSRILLPLVGKPTICSELVSNTVSVGVGLCSNNQPGGTFP